MPSGVDVNINLTAKNLSRLSNGVSPGISLNLVESTMTRYRCMIIVMIVMASTSANRRPMQALGPTEKGTNASLGQSAFKKRSGVNANGSSQNRAAEGFSVPLGNFVPELTIVVHSRYMDNYVGALGHCHDLVTVSSWVFRGGHSCMDGKNRFLFGHFHDFDDLLRVNTGTPSDPTHGIPAGTVSTPRRMLREPDQAMGYPHRPAECRSTPEFIKVFPHIPSLYPQEPL